MISEPSLALCTMSVFADLYRPKTWDHVFGTPADHVVGPIGTISQVGCVERMWRLQKKFKLVCQSADNTNVLESESLFRLASVISAHID